MRVGETARAKELLGRFQELWAFDKKTNELRAHLDREPGDAVAREELIRHLLEAGRFEEVRRFSKNALARNPELPESYLMMARVHLALSESEQAIDVLEKGLELHPDASELRRALAEARPRNPPKP